MRYLKLSTRAVYRALGFAGTTIPAGETVAPIQLSDGLIYFVNIGSRGVRVANDPLRPRQNWRSRKHRVFVQCPECDKAVPSGRLHQHAKVHGSHVSHTSHL